MKLKDLMEKYGEYEIYTDSPKHIEEAFKNLDSKDDGVLCLYAKKPKPKTVWELKKGSDNYYYIDEDGDVVISTWYDWNCDRDRLNIGSAFLTEEEALRDVERRKVETLLLKHGGRRWYKKSADNYALKVDDSNRLTINYLTHTQGTIYFSTFEDIEKAIEEIGEERIKDALFEVR